MPVVGGRWWWKSTIRTRLVIVMSIALVPVLLLSAVQSVLIFNHESLERKVDLTGAVERSATSANARINYAGVLLRGLGMVSAGPECASRLAEIRDRIPGYANLLRFNSAGEVQCAASPAPADSLRADRPWFRALRHGSSMTVTIEPGVTYGEEPVLLVSVPAQYGKGPPVGVLTGVITLKSLRPDTDPRFDPPGSETALADRTGRLLTSTRAVAFPVTLQARDTSGVAGRTWVWSGKDRLGQDRLFTVAPLAEGNIRAVFSAPYRDVIAWVWLNPLSAAGLPLLAFGLALAGVWVVADHGLVRWIRYLQRIAAIYAHGRYNIHPQRAQRAPPEIRDLAETLDSMATEIATRDRALRENLVHKDDLLREIHHRVKNNLQVVSSLLNMQQRTLIDPAARAAISDTQQRIAALALIYRALYEGPDLRKVDLRTFLGELINQLIMSDTGTRTNVRTELVVDTLTIDPDHLAPLALFAVEAISNAKKHGLAQSGGALMVSFRVRGDHAELAITDSGREGAAPTLVGEGVGSTLMRAFARQLGGAASFRTETGGGMTASLTFPAPGAATPS